MKRLEFMNNFENNAQLGAFGEYVYMEHSKALGFKIERTNLCHTDYYLEEQNKNNFYYVDVKSTTSDRTKYFGKRYHDEIVYESILVLRDRVIFVPDKISPFFGLGRKDLGTLSGWMDAWGARNDKSAKRIRKISETNLKGLKTAFENSVFPKMRLVERGDASGKRWSGTIDNLPGTTSTIDKYDATLFIEYGCENFKEKINKIYLILHHLLRSDSIKMIKSNSRQLKKGLTHHIDILSFEKDYPQFVFEQITSLEKFINSANPSLLGLEKS